MRLTRVLEQVHYRPWLITPEGHASIRDLVAMKVEADVRRFTELHGERPKTDFFGEPIPQMEIRNHVAIIPVKGVIGHGLGSIEKSCGAVGTEDIAEDIHTALNKRVKAIVLEVNSPGGTIAGVPELADIIGKARDRVPVYAFTDGLNASAAYWVSSTAHEIYATPSSEIGSIGVYIPWIDSRAYYEERGIKIEPITNTGGDLKAAGMPGTSLTETQRAEWQRQVDQIAGMFQEHVTVFRGPVPEGTMRGQVFMAREAVERRLIDGVVSGIDEVLSIAAGSCG